MKVHIAPVAFSAFHKSENITINLQPGARVLGIVPYITDGETLGAFVFYAEVAP